MTAVAPPADPNGELGRETSSFIQPAEVRRVTLGGLIVNLALSAVKFLFGVIGASHNSISNRGIAE